MSAVATLQDEFVRFLSDVHPHWNGDADELLVHISRENSGFGQWQIAYLRDFCRRWEALAVPTQSAGLIKRYERAVNGGSNDVECEAASLLIHSLRTELRECERAEVAANAERERLDGLLTAACEQGAEHYQQTLDLTAERDAARKELDELKEAAGELLKNTEFADGQGIVLTQDAEALSDLIGYHPDDLGNIDHEDGDYASETRLRAMERGL